MSGTAENRGRQRHCDLGSEVIAITLEAGVGTNIDDQIEITSGTTCLTWVALSGEANAGSGCDTRWDRGFDPSLLPVREAQRELAGGASVCLGQRDVNRRFEIASGAGAWRCSPTCTTETADSAHVAAEHRLEEIGEGC